MAAYTLESLVETILDLSQTDLAEAGSIGRRPEGGADLSAIASLIVAERRAAARNTGIRFVERLDPDVPPVDVAADAARQLIRHLVGVAIGSCENGNEIVISTSRDDELLKISVSDNGRPFEDEDIPEDFYDTLDTVVLSGHQRAAATGDGAQAGVAVTPLGLTLAVIRALLSRQGGMLEVANRRGGGKEIIVAFPLEKAFVTAVQQDRVAAIPAE